MPDDEDTIDVENTEDRTVVVDRDEDRTVVIDRRGVDPDKTVVVDRRRPADPAATPAATPAAAPDPVLRLLPARGVETYPPRPMAPAPLPGPGVERAGDASRADGRALPSVVRGSRATGAVTLLVFAGACVVSLVGVVAIVAWFVRG